MSTALTSQGSLVRSQSRPPYPPSTCTTFAQLLFGSVEPIRGSTTWQHPADSQVRSERRLARSSCCRRARDTARPAPWVPRPPPSIPLQCAAKRGVSISRQPAELQLQLLSLPTARAYHPTR